MRGMRAAQPLEPGGALRVGLALAMRHEKRAEALLELQARESRHHLLDRA